MEEEASPSTSAYDGPRKPRKRVKAACERCRRQKLGCDKDRPCSMCLRSGMECVAGLATTAPSQLKRRRIDAKTKRYAHSPHCNDGLESCFSSPTNKDISIPPEVANGRDREEDEQKQAFALQHIQGKSAIHITREIFSQFEAGLEDENETYALPGGTVVSERPDTSSDKEIQIPLLELVGLELPPKEITDFLLDIYLESVHWFMMVLHEPSFRADYESIVATRTAPRRKFSFVVLLLTVLLLGSRYTTSQAAQKDFPGLDMKSLQNSLLRKVREHIFDIYDEAQLEAVQITILLSSFYMYNARPNLALALFGAGVKIAQGMGLHRESSWKPTSVLVRETRRRAWWALYVCDRFGSIAFGRPCSINDLDCDVAMVQNLDDASAQHPKLNSKEIMEDGSSVWVTLMTYHRFKFRLYRIASSIIGNVYFLRGASQGQVIEQVTNFHQKLLSWYESLPKELRPERYDPKLESPKSIEIIFKLQAVALQQGYDNIMILLHRPLLQLNLGGSTLRSIDAISLISAESPTKVGSTMLRAQSISRRQCWESAIRTSKMIELVDVVRFVKNTHAAAYTGIQLFTAGIFLSVVALSQPLSSQAQEAKQAIGRIIRLSKAFSHQTVLSAQSSKLLGSLVKVILAKEMKELLPEQSLDAEDDGVFSSMQPTPRPSSPARDIHAENEQDKESWGIQSGFPPAQGPDDSQLAIDDLYTGRSLSVTLGSTDFNEGMLSLQEVLRNSSHRLMMEGTIPHIQMTGQDNQSLNQDNDLVDVGLSHPTNETDNLGSIFGETYGNLNDSGQAWIWEMDLAPF